MPDGKVWGKPLPEFVGDEAIESLEKLRDSLKETSPNRTVKFSQTVIVETLSFEEGEMERHPVVDFERMPSVMELLEFIAHRSLREQIFMVCNVLTISGYTQSEIAAGLGVDHQTYRNTLLNVRKDMREEKAVC